MINKEWMEKFLFGRMRNRWEKAASGSTFGRDGYVRSATYFGDEWPMNFWNSKMDHLDGDFRQIREDGFDSIILVIPWEEFQVSQEPVQYSDYAFDQLERVMKAAGKAGLKVYSRISYLWDLIGDEQEDIFGRIVMLFHNPVIRNAWLDYAGELYRRLSAWDCFMGGFLTWEDYMKPIFSLCDSESGQQRVDDAKLLGYQDWLRERYTPETFNAAFGTDYAAVESIPIPRRKEPAMATLYAFFDDQLNRLLADGQKVFPNLSNEIRLDADVVYGLDGQPGYYTHEATYSCGQADYTAAMYGIPMGFENIGERVKASEALEHTRFILANLAGKNEGKPVYLEQFLFYDNTPRFAHNARLEEEEVEGYLLAVPEILKQYSRGYGVWPYRDYYDNMLFNNGFYLKERGWETEGEVGFEQGKDFAVCSLTAPAILRQRIPKVRDHFEAKELVVSFEIAKCRESGEIRVGIGEEGKTLRIDRAGAYEARFTRGDSLDLSLELLSGTLCIDKVRVYSHVQNSHLYDPGNNPLELRDAIRKMNALLSAE